MYSTVVTVTNKTGLHARPAKLFTQQAASFQAKIMIESNGKTVDAKSILKVLSLGVKQGTVLTISAEGADEKEAVDSLVNLMQSFEE